MDASETAKEKRTRRAQEKRNRKKKQRTLAALDAKFKAPVKKPAPFSERKHVQEQLLASGGEAARNVPASALAAVDLAGTIQGLRNSGQVDAFVHELLSRPVKDNQAAVREGEEIDRTIAQKLQHKVLLLENSQRSASIAAMHEKKLAERRKAAEARKGSKPSRVRKMTWKSRERVFVPSKAPTDTQNTKAADPEALYNHYLVMHSLWKQYISSILTDTDRDETVENVIVRCDLQGAMVTIVESKVPTLIGLAGIVAAETLTTFHIVTPDHGIKIVAKGVCNFVFTVDDREVKIFGRNFCVRPSERAVRKFKSRATISL